MDLAKNRFGGNEEKADPCFCLENPDNEKMYLPVLCFCKAGRFLRIGEDLDMEYLLSDPSV